MKVIKGYFFPSNDTEYVKYFKEFDHYQKEQRDFSYQFVEKFDLAIDIGANLGLWARDFTEKFKHTICFEPNPKCIPYLKKNITQDKSTIYQIGLGNRNENKELFSPHDLGTSSYVNFTKIGLTDSGEKIWGQFDKSTEKINTEIKVLDDFEFSNIDYIKIDVQGFEENVLKGAEKTLNSNNPVLCIEFDHQSNSYSIESFLFKLNFKNVGNIGKERIFKKTL